MRERNAPINDAHVNAIHPGPGADYRPPVSEVLTSQQRLARDEAELLELAVDRHIHASGRLGELAVRVTVLRAETRSQGAMQG